MPLSMTACAASVPEGAVRMRPAGEVSVVASCGDRVLGGEEASTNRCSS